MAHPDYGPEAGQLFPRESLTLGRRSLKFYTAASLHTCDQSLIAWALSDSARNRVHCDPKKSSSSVLRGRRPRWHLAASATSTETCSCAEFDGSTSPHEGQGGVLVPLFSQKPQSCVLRGLIGGAKEMPPWLKSLLWGLNPHSAYKAGHRRARL